MVAPLDFVQAARHTQGQIRWRGRCAGKDRGPPRALRAWSGRGGVVGQDAMRAPLTPATDDAAAEAAAEGTSQPTGGRRRDRARRRQANIPGGRPFEHKVRVSEAEEAVLVRLASAAHLSVPRLLVESALASDGPMRADQARDMLTELFALQRLMGAMARNLNQVAAATNSTGAIPPQAAAVFDGALRVMQRADAMIEALPTVSQIKAAEHTRRRRRVAAVFGEEAASAVAPASASDASAAVAQTAAQSLSRTPDEGPQR